MSGPGSTGRPGSAPLLPPGQGSPCAVRELGRSRAGPVGRVPGAPPMGGRAAPGCRGPFPVLPVREPRFCSPVRGGDSVPGPARSCCWAGEALAQRSPGAVGLLRKLGCSVPRVTPPAALEATSERLDIAVPTRGVGLPFAHRPACGVWGLRGPRGMRVTWHPPDSPPRVRGAGHRADRGSQLSP